MKIKIYLITALLLIGIFSFLIQAVPEVENKKADQIQRIVSLAPSATESLFALGYGHKVVGISNYCMYPAEVQALPRMGALDDPNFEAIIRLKPDLVVSGSARHEDYLNKLGLNFLLLKQDRLHEILPSLQKLDQFLGEQGQDYLENWAKSYAQIQSKNKKELKILISIMREPYTPVRSLYIAGQDGYFSEIIELFGAKNVYKGKLKFPILSSEALLQLKPDLIVDLLPPKTDINKAKEDWQALNLEAVKNNRLLILADESALVPGPRTLDFIQELDNFINMSE